MKRVLAMVISVMLVATMAIGGSIAYLQDSDGKVNVMTLGNVNIEQYEKEWAEDNDGNPYLKDFTQGKPLYPYVGKVEWDDMTETGEDYRRFTMNNVVDKYVNVENVGKSDAYLRTVFAFEMGSLTVEEMETYLGMSVNSKGGTYGESKWIWGDLSSWAKQPIATINGNTYMLFEAIYETAIEPGYITEPSLLQVYLDKTATNDTCTRIDGNQNGLYDILVVSQAVQTAGFEPELDAEGNIIKSAAEVALDEALGNITKDTHPWAGEDAASAGKSIAVTVSNTEELADAIAASEDYDVTVITLKTGDYETNFEIPGGKSITINGNKGTVLSGQIATTASNAGTLTLNGVTVKVDSSIEDSTGISQTGKSAIAIWGDQTVICNNVTFDMSLNDSTAITSWWDTGKGTSIICRNCTFNANGQRPIRATGNVTVENCSFNDPYRYAVQLTAKASTATELDKAIINFNNNTIVDGANGKDFVYGIQLEGADYGCHDLVINGSGNSIMDGGANSTLYYCECGKVQHATIEWHTEAKPVHETLVEVDSASALISALEAGGDVMLTDDLTLDKNAAISIASGKTATVDLNGHDITVTQDTTTTYGLFNVAKGATLNIKGDGDVTLKTNVINGISACIFQNDGILNIYGGNYEANQEQSVSGLGAVISVIDNCPYDNDSTVNIYGGSFSITGEGAINLFRNWPIQSGKASLNIYDGTFNANPSKSTTYIWSKNDTNLGSTLSFVNIEGGTFNGKIVVEVDGYKEDQKVADGLGVEIVEGSIIGYKEKP